MFVAWHPADSTLSPQFSWAVIVLLFLIVSALPGRNIILHLRVWHVGEAGGICQGVILTSENIIHTIITLSSGMLLWTWNYSKVSNWIFKVEFRRRPWVFQVSTENEKCTNLIRIKRRSRLRLTIKVSTGFLILDTIWQLVSRSFTGWNHNYMLN